MTSQKLTTLDVLDELMKCTDARELYLILRVNLSNIATRKKKQERENVMSFTHLF